jgi:hypothetical protein
MGQAEWRKRPRIERLHVFHRKGASHVGARRRAIEFQRLRVDRVEEGDEFTMTGRESGMNDVMLGVSRDGPRGNGRDSGPLWMSVHEEGEAVRRRRHDIRRAKTTSYTHPPATPHGLVKPYQRALRLVSPFAFARSH